MFPLYWLGFTLLWYSYRIGLLSPFKTNNLTRFLFRIAFTTLFESDIKSIRQVSQRHENMPKHNGDRLMDWLSVKCGSTHVKIGNILKNFNWTFKQVQLVLSRALLFFHNVWCWKKSNTCLKQLKWFIFLHYTTLQTFLNFQ